MAAARVRALTDPLGAKGQRQTASRIRREQRARRTVAGVALVAFIAFFWLTAGMRRGATTGSAALPAPSPTVRTVGQTAGGDGSTPQTDQLFVLQGSQPATPTPTAAAIQPAFDMANAVSRLGQEPATAVSTAAPTPAAVPTQPPVPTAMPTELTAPTAVPTDPPAPQVITRTS